MSRFEWWWCTRVPWWVRGIVEVAVVFTSAVLIVGVMALGMAALAAQQGGAQ